MGKLKNFFNCLKDKIKIPAFVKKHKIISIIILLLIILIIIFSFGRKEEVSATLVSDYKVGYKDISVTITGSGTLEANEQYDITSLVSGEVLADHFQEGDLIDEGSIMYEIDSTNAQSTITRAQNSLEKAQNQYSDAADNVANLNVKSKINGVVTEVNAKKGDKVAQNTHMFTVVDYDTLILTIFFNEEDAKSIHKGDLGEVYLTEGGYVLDGVVDTVSSGAIISSAGAKVSQVKMIVKNPGTIVAGDTATAIVNSVACASEGTFEENAVRKINALVAGDVSRINVTVGDRVTNGSVLAVIESSNTNKSLREAQLSYNDAQTSLSDAYDSLDDYTITAPITGTVIKKTTKAGDKISQGSGGQTVMAIVADMTKMKFTIYVDELDITKMKTGSKVKVTADAVEGEVYEGYIDNISIVGTTSNSVTTYPVTVVLEEYGELIPGMNVDAEITVAEAKNVLSVPLSAVQRGNMVYVKNEDLKDSQKMTDNKNPDAENKYMNEREKMFEGYTAIRVKTGLSNSDTVEITEGLFEGQRVAVISVSGSGNSLMEDMMKMRPMGGEGNMSGGGMPGGNMPGGGNRQ